jgi:hypothetical protein
VLAQLHGRPLLRRRCLRLCFAIGEEPAHSALPLSQCHKADGRPGVSSPKLLSWRDFGLERRRRLLNFFLQESLFGVLMTGVCTP